MSYQILARKYRPQQFDEVVAQAHVTRTLINALASERVSSGYLFTGPRGTGKTTTARILAKALNCAEGPTSTPCDKCASCREIIGGSSLDVLEIDAASNTGVDDIRTLRENVRYLPTSGKKRIYIIDEVHRLSGSAFDALLKTLEEPPPHVVFIFATTEPHKVPETIRSRTQRYDFHRVAVPELIEHLQDIAGREKIAIEDEALAMIARKADGSVRDGMSLLDQMSAFAGDKIEMKHVAEALGLIDRQFYLDYVRAIASKDTAGALDMVRQLIDSGVDIPEFCSGLAEHLRHLMILKNATDPERFLELSQTEIESLKAQVDFFSTGDLLRMIELITDMSLDLKSGLEPRLLLETNSLKLVSMESTIYFEEIIAHLSADEEPAEENKDESDNADLFATPKAPEKSPAAVEKPPERDAPEKESGGPAPVRAINLPLVQTSWKSFVEHLRRQNPMLAALLGMAEVQEVRDNVITAVFRNAGGTSKQVVEKPNYQAVITAALRDFFKTNLKIQYDIDATGKTGGPSKGTAVGSEIDADKILEKNKKLKDIVERFDGEIIGKKSSEQ